MIARLKIMSGMRVGVKKINLGYVYVLITVSAWGSTYVVSKFILGMVPPLTILFLRFLVGAAALSLVLARRGWVKIERRDFKMIFLLGFVGYFIGVGAQMLGIKYSNASVASLLNAMNPIFIILFAVPLLKEKITVYKLVSVAAAVAGAFIIIGGVQDSGMVTGALMCLLCVLAWSLMSVASKHLSIKYDSLAVTTYAMLVALVFMLPVSLIEIALTPNVRLFEPGPIAAVLYMGCITTALAYVLWNKSISMMEAGLASLFYPVQPMVSVILGTIFLGERMNASFFIGAALIVGGVVYSILAGRRALPATG
jgi:drug/metabolite transporter (DMT)-like permease